jgi:hypothetical protein
MTTDGNYMGLKAQVNFEPQPGEFPDMSDPEVQILSVDSEMAMLAGWPDYHGSGDNSALDASRGG